MHADEGWNRIEKIEENGLKGWKLGWRWKGDATEAKRRRDAEAIIDSCKEKQPQLLVLLRNAQYLNGQSYSPPRR